MACHWRLDVGPVMGSGVPAFRTYREGDEAAIMRALQKAAAAECSLDEWAWLFPPREDGRAIVVGESNGEMTAVCAGVPVRVVVDGREWSAVELRQLASRDLDDVGRVVDHFVQTFGSSGRFELAIASFDADGEVPRGFDRGARGRLSTLVREKPAFGAHRRLRYRAEPARDWEPRLDALWKRVQCSYPVAVVRDADHGLRRFAAHPRVRHHRFLIFPRFSAGAVASAVFVDDGSRCRWLDLLWDHAHPGALELLAHISGGLAAQFGGVGEELWLAGDDAARATLMDRGFRPGGPSPPLVAARSFHPELDARDFVDRSYLTLADVAGLGR